MAQRALYEVAMEIKKLWKEPYFGAVPYLNAMLELQDIRQMYGLDPADSVVRYFLSNATRWHGDDARRIKKELNDMLVEHKKSWEDI
jgi:hypothetical protein